MTVVNSLRQLVMGEDVRGAQARRFMLGALPGWHVRQGTDPMGRRPAASSSRIPVSSSPSRLSLHRHHEHPIATFPTRLSEHRSLRPRAEMSRQVPAVALNV
jgi:hypothetical protein